MSTLKSQNVIIEKARKLQRDDILLRVAGQGHDMVANDICYHKTCMDNFKASIVPIGKSSIQKSYDAAYSRLFQEIDVPLFDESHGFLVIFLRDQYRSILKNWV